LGDYGDYFFFSSRRSGLLENLSLHLSWIWHHLPAF